MTTVAVFNSSEDTIELLRMRFEEAGFQTVAGHVPDIKRGQLDFVAFMEKHQPEALVIDVSLPYAENWTFVRLLRDTTAMQGRVLVLTTTHKRALDELVGPTDTIEILGKPYEADAVVEAVQKGLARRAI
jgi:DNA-binding response OmpR family regulator